uniref:snRNA-activating protein complex subunit 4 n=1 Tax=Angiostrongylus cantonensis TaxID=6313 RepID=A0A158P858_ANGCA
MDLASTSFDFLETNIESDCATSACTDLVLVSDEDLIADCNPTADRYAELLGLVEAQIELIDRHLYEIEMKRKGLSEKKLVLEKKMEQGQLQHRPIRNKFPVIQYLPPYFKDENMMCPPLNEEAKHKLQYTTFDPLVKEDKKWTSNELRLLRKSVENSLIQAGIQKFIDRKQIIRSKIHRAGVECTNEELKAWREEIEALDRKIKHWRAGQVDSREVDVVEYSCVDWMKMSIVEFKGTRSATALKYKWLNEQCPRWNSGPWMKEELERLKQLREEESFTSWAALAKKLGTDRTPYQCFEKYRSDFFKSTKEWTKEEDDRLVALVKILSVNGTVQWDKGCIFVLVCFYMPGRNRQQVRTRYLRTLDENVRHGRWTDDEDLLLMSAVARFGARDWPKVANWVSLCVLILIFIYGWCNVLGCTETNDWTTEEDERLVFGVQMFGRGQWAKIAILLPRHNPAGIRKRYQRLLTTKMRMRQQLTDDGLKGRFYRAAKEQAEKNPSTKLSNVRQGIKFNDEEKALLEKGIEEITKKFRSSNRTPSATEVFKNISLTRKEIGRIKIAAQKYATGERPIRIYHQTGGVRKISKNTYLLPNALYERTVFDPEETEEERIIYLTEALCHAVRRYDQYDWCNKFFASRSTPEMVASNFVTNVATFYAHFRLPCSAAGIVKVGIACLMLSNRCVGVANSLKQCLPLPPGTILPPTFTTTSAYRVFERARLSLTKRALCYFYPCSVDAANTSAMPHGDGVGVFTAQVRCLLREPIRLAFAIDPGVEQQRNRDRTELIQTGMEEQEFPYEEHKLNNVENEVVISSTEHCGTIDYDDPVDDALNETVHTRRQKSMENLGTSANNGILQTRVAEIRLVANMGKTLQQVCNDTDLSKHKHGGPKKGEAVEGAQEMQMVESQSK